MTGAGLRAGARPPGDLRRLPGQPRARHSGASRRLHALLGPLTAQLFPRLALRWLPPGDPSFARAGEHLAARHLRRLGWRLLDRRVRTTWAEIDLLFEDHGALVAVEVKTGRSGPRFQPGMRLARATIARLEHAVAALARGAPARVDLVEVRLEGPGRIAIVRRADLRVGPG
ncbi:MAG TPA: YraN family protein [Planctomycetota bacterium]